MFVAGYCCRGFRTLVCSLFFCTSPSGTLTAQQIAQQIDSNKIIVNMIFRSTTVPIFILVVSWIIILIVPKITITSRRLIELKLYSLKRRYLKEFCWCLFGGLFIFEFIFYFAISYKTVPNALGYIGAIPAYVLTFFAVWQYRKDDIFQMRRPTKALLISSFLEHGIVFAIAYLTMIVIWGYSIIIPSL